MNDGFSVFGPRGAFLSARHAPCAAPWFSFSGRAGCSVVSLVLALCAAVFFSCAAPPALAAHVSVYIQPYSVDLQTQGAFAVGEVVPLEVIGLQDGASVSNWVAALSKGTNVVGVCTNFLADTNGVVSGTVDCATVEMGALFKGAGPLAERDVFFTILETTDGGLSGRLVASGTAIVRNNPLSPEAIAQFAPTGEQLWNSAFFDALREWADARFATPFDTVTNGSFTNFSFPRGISLGGYLLTVAYPWFVTNFNGIVRAYTNPGRSTIVASTDNVCLSTPEAYFVVDSNGNSSKAYSSVPVEAPGFKLGNKTVRSWGDLTNGLDSRIDSLYGECAGGWRWPIWLDLDDMWPDAAFATNASTATVTAGCMRVERTATTVLGNDWIFVPWVRDNRAGLSPSLAWEPVAAPGGGGIDPSLLEASTFLDDPGDEWERCRVSFAEGVTPSDLPEDPAEWVATVRGSLVADGETVFSRDFELCPEVSEADSFLGPVSNTVFAAAWDAVMTAAADSSKAVQPFTWPNGYGDGTNHPTVSWNTNWWAWDLVDLSCTAYHTDRYGIEHPATLVTPRHVLAANHYRPDANATLYFLSRSGEIKTNSVTEWTVPRSDIAVGRLAVPFSTNDFAIATLLATNYESFVIGSPNTPSDTCWGIPVISLDIVERARVAGWKPNSLRYGDVRSDGGTMRVSGRFFNDSTNLPAIPRVTVTDHTRGWAEGGDSGHPTFLCLGGGRPPILLGLWWHNTDGPMPNKAEIDAAIRGTWGDTERCQEYRLSSRDFTPVAQ